MKNSRENFLTNIIVDQISAYYDKMFQDSSLRELENKRQIVLIRSAKIEVLYKLLQYLKSKSYSGNIYIIGRKEDETVISEFETLDIFVSTVDERHNYTIENTSKYIEKVNADAVCFLYQKKISDNHDNLLEIVNKYPCEGYAVSRDLGVVKFAGLDKYLTGKHIYKALCDWLYQEGIKIK